MMKKVAIFIGAFIAFVILPNIVFDNDTYTDAEKLLAAKMVPILRDIMKLQKEPEFLMGFRLKTGLHTKMRL